jgi:hypothetical protein
MPDKKQTKSKTLMIIARSRIGREKKKFERDKRRPGQIDPFFSSSDLGVGKTRGRRRKKKKKKTRPVIL